MARTRCANCGTTKTRILHGPHYCGRPVCDRCHNYAERHRGAYRRKRSYSPRKRSKITGRFIK